MPAILLCVCYTPAETEIFDSSSKKKLPVMEDKLSSMNIMEEVGSPEKKQKYDDTGNHKLCQVS